jgi:hypothetical protein
MADKKVRVDVGSEEYILSGKRYGPGIVMVDNQEIADVLEAARERVEGLNRDREETGGLASSEPVSGGSETIESLALKPKSELLAMAEQRGIAVGPKATRMDIAKLLMGDEADMEDEEEEEDS